MRPGIRGNARGVDDFGVFGNLYGLSGAGSDDVRAFKQDYGVRYRLASVPSIIVAPVIAFIAHAS